MAPGSFDIVLAVFGAWMLASAFFTTYILNKRNVFQDMLPLQRVGFILGRLGRIIIGTTAILIGVYQKPFGGPFLYPVILGAACILSSPLLLSVGQVLKRRRESRSP